MVKNLERQKLLYFVEVFSWLTALSFNLYRVGPWLLLQPAKDRTSLVELSLWEECFCLIRPYEAQWEYVFLCWCKYLAFRLSVSWCSFVRIWLQVVKSVLVITENFATEADDACLALLCYVFRKDCWDSHPPFFQTSFWATWVITRVRATRVRWATRKMLMFFSANVYILHYCQPFAHRQSRKIGPFSRLKLSRTLIKSRLLSLIPRWLTDAPTRKGYFTVSVR